MPSQQKFAGYAFAAMGAALFSTKAIFVKLAYMDRVDPALMLEWRMIFSMPFYAVIGFWAYDQKRRRGDAMPDGKSLSLAAGTGFVGYYMASQFDFAGLAYISAQLERLVLFTYPLFVMFIGWAFYGHKLTRTGVAAAAITYLGLMIVFALDLPEGGRSTVIGTLLVLCAAITFALHQIWARQVMAPLGSALFTSVAMTSASFFCVLHQVVMGEGRFAASPRFLWLSAGCAVVATVAPTFLINAGLARITSQAVSMISTLSPVVTIALAVAILGEPFTLADAIGTSLVICGVGLYAWGDSRGY